MCGSQNKIRVLFAEEDSEAQEVSCGIPSCRISNFDPGCVSTRLHYMRCGWVELVS